MKKWNKQNWAEYYNNLDYYEGIQNDQPADRTEMIPVDKTQLEEIAEILSMASYTMEKHGIHIFNVTEKVSEAEQLTFEILEQYNNKL